MGVPRGYIATALGELPCVRMFLVRWGERTYTPAEAAAGSRAGKALHGAGEGVMVIGGEEDGRVHRHPLVSGQPAWDLRE